MEGWWRVSCMLLAVPNALLNIMCNKIKGNISEASKNERDNNTQKNECV